MSIQRLNLRDGRGQRDTFDYKSTPQARALGPCSVILRKEQEAIK